MQDPRDPKTYSTTEEVCLHPGAQALQPVLVVVGSAAAGGGTSGVRLVRFERSIEIGRRPASDNADATCVLDDPAISGRQARVASIRPGAFEIRDLESKNGTLVEGRLIQRPTPISDGTLIFAGGHALIFRLLAGEVLAAIEEEATQPLGPVATTSGEMAQAIRRLRRLAPTNAEVLLAGETGVGKEVYARALHKASGRPGGFVAVNCAALPGELVESELFGFVRGAHSQAAAGKPGIVEQAERGTLFLDEISDMPAQAQAKLLRFLQQHEYTPLGAREARRIDVRVVAAMSSGSSSSQGLRQDLGARLGAEPIVLPPLRERREDIGALCRHFITSAQPIDNAAFLALCLHRWPQNVRELEKVLAEAALHSEVGQKIQLQHLPRSIADQLVKSNDQPHQQRRSPRPRPSREQLESLLLQNQGSVQKVASTLERHWSVVRRWIVADGLEAKTNHRAGAK